jgi:hypothetical protein
VFAGLDFYMNIYCRIGCAIGEKHVFAVQKYPEPAGIGFMSGEIGFMRIGIVEP